MIHSGVCSVIIDPVPEKGYFSDNETVRGYVKVDVHRELHVASVEATLRCEDRGRAYTRDNEELVDLSAAHFDTFEILWESPTITFDIPVDGMLSKGSHKFPFEFTSPVDASSLPSSFNVEAKHDFNGVFWGVSATIDRDTRIRSNYRGFGEIKMLPQRWKSFSGDYNSFENTEHHIHIKIHRRPSFLLSDSENNIVRVDSKLAVPATGLSQSRKVADKEGAELPEIRVAVRSDKPALIKLKEIIIFLDTTTLTLVDGNESMSKSCAIVISRNCDETLKGGNDWQDISQLISDARIYGLPESWTTNIHHISHVIRVQLILAPVDKENRTSILEVSVPVNLHSEVTCMDTSCSLPTYSSEKPGEIYDQYVGENAEKQTQSEKSTDTNDRINIADNKTVIPVSDYVRLAEGQRCQSS